MWSLLIFGLDSLVTCTYDLKCSEPDDRTVPEVHVPDYQTFKEELNNVRRITNYKREYYGRITEIMYGRTKVERWGEDVRDETRGVI
jgi:hypothetical protein